MWDRISRRRFLRAAAAVSITAKVGSRLRPAESAVAAAALTRVDAVPVGVTRTWLAPEYWANRLADWRLHAGRLECVTAGAGARTVGVLTRSLVPGSLAGSASLRMGTLSDGSGFSGFLVGAGAGALDWRAAALVMGASGTGGGFLAVYDSSGHVQFREHTNESNQFAYAILPSTGRSGPAPPRSRSEDVVLRLDIVPTAAGRFDLVLTARVAATGVLLSTATRAGIAAGEVVGGLSLVSGSLGSARTARHWLRELMTTGPKLAVQNRRAGPVLGTLYSVNGSVLKLTAQFMPIGATEPRQATLEIRLAGGTAWRSVGTAQIGAGWTALFRITGWDPTQAWEYRVAYAVGSAGEARWSGVIQRDPGSQSSLAIAMVNCTIHSYRNLDVASDGRPRLPGEQPLGLYTAANLYFPYAELVRNIQRHQPDVLVAFGDQYYENKPTVIDRANLLDVLGKYFLWLWSFRDITRNKPTICLVDDHDVYHGNLWGWSGRPAPDGDRDYGGYVQPASWVNVVQRVQCGHNPDAHDPTPVLQGISVYYSAFSYGGVSFAVLEDRKFKNTNRFGTDPAGNPLPAPRDLLGDRQEAFLSAWAGMHPGQPKVCLTQTIFACVQTEVNGAPTTDPDSNGTPVTGRRAAIRALKQARALVLSGDQHLGTLVRHGVDTFTDGPVQFTAPAGGTAWQRWFQPPGALPNGNGTNTGDFTDGYGNRFRVLAVANPKVTFAQVRAVRPYNDVGDRNLKREGYGIVRVDHVDRSYRVECWPWRPDPAVPGTTQYPGWPYRLPFGQA